MKTCVLTALLCVVAAASAADTIEEMHQAIADNDAIQGKATALWDAKTAYDAALADYKKFRTEHHNIALSKDSAPFVFNADKLIDFKTDETAQKMMLAAAEEQAKAIADKQRSDSNAAWLQVDKRTNAQKKVTAAQNKVTAAVNAFRSAQADLGAAEESNSRRSVSGTTGTQTVSPAMDILAFQKRVINARTAMETYELELQRAQEELASVVGDQPPQQQPDPSNMIPHGPGPGPGPGQQHAPLPPVTPPAAKQRVLLTVFMKDGKKIDAFSSMEAGDVYIVKTATGVQKLKKDEVEKIERTDEK